MDILGPFGESTTEGLNPLKSKSKNDLQKYEPIKFSIVY
jgi:hypothetical protein